MSRSETVVVGGVRLAFEVRGQVEYPKMVLLHALGKQRGSWDLVADRFAESFQVFTLDLRGHGDSDRSGSYSFEAMCDDVAGLLDHLGLQSTVLIGHSMGGVISYLLALQRSDLVERLIIEDVPPPYERDQPLPIRPTDADSFDFDWEVVPAIIAEVNAGAPEMWANLETIAVPTLVIAGGQESHIPQNKLRDVADRIPTCDLVTIPAGHHVHESEPNRFVDAIDEWLSSR